MKYSVVLLFLSSVVHTECINTFLQEMRFEEALQKFSTALVVLGYNPHLSYNVALCFYRLKEYAPALKHIGILSC